jgi:methionyl-tRNA formyltransferase
MRVVFLGTPAFAVPSLQALVEARCDIVAVFTQPDRPKGRGNEVAQSPVKEAALQMGVPVHQPERIRRPENVDLLRSLSPDMMIVVGYGQIIPQSIIDLAPAGILNVHASLLPRYRGAAPIQWAIANGEQKTGVTLMRIDAGLDTGDMLLKEETAIGADETAPELSARLAVMGAGLLTRYIKEGSGVKKQNDAEATYAPVLKKEDGRVDWTRPASVIYNRLRGFTPWPGAFTEFRGQQLSIISAKPDLSDGVTVPGRFQREGRRLFAVCGGNSRLELLEIQLAGKKRLTAEAFLNGYKISDQDLAGAAE